MAAEERNYYVNLSEKPIKFDPKSDFNNIYYDEDNQQVFSIRSGGVTGVQVRGPSPQLCHTFRMVDKGPITCIKMSSSQKILALHRAKSVMELHNFNGNELDENCYLLNSKHKYATIQKFFWTYEDEILVITDQGVELFQVFPDKKQVKPLRNINLSICWFNICLKSKVLILASAAGSNCMQPVLYNQPGQLIKAPKFQVEVPITKSKEGISPRDMTVTSLYGQTCVLLLRTPLRPPGAPQPGSQVLIYTMHKTLHTTRKTHTLALECSGRFAFQFIDNLIMVHHQASRTTMLFDIGCNLEAAEPVLLKTILPPLSLFVYPIASEGDEVFTPPVYSTNWMVFQPNIILDVRLGYCWTVELNLENLVKICNNSVKLIDFLLRRKPSTLPLILTVIQELTDPTQPSKDLSTIGEIFDLINQPYRRELIALAQPHIGQPAGTMTSHAINNKSSGNLSLPDMIVIDQGLMYSQIFSRFPEKRLERDNEGEYGIKIILEYIRSLTDAKIPVQDLNELLITCLMKEDSGLARLQMLLQYRVLSDSKPLACSLISLENVYPPVLQLALDMLKRLGNADDEIIEILLHKRLILPALRYVQGAGLQDQIPARKFLEAAKATGDSKIFCAVFKFFELRNIRLRGTSGFVKGELCDSYVEYFRKVIRIQSS